MIQCKICSIESLNKNLCISCDTEEGYYPIYDDLYINNLNFTIALNHLKAIFMIMKFQYINYAINHVKIVKKKEMKLRIIV